MKKVDHFFCARTSRSGVALIIVLGMMGLLMILGVAFSVTMRTERMSAGFYGHQIRGEHLAHAAVAQAMAQVSGNMDDSVYPDWGMIDDQRAIVTGSVSQDPEAESCTDLLTATIRQYLPALVLDQAEGYVEDGNVQWIDSPSGLGAYAYLVINTSGFMDANHAGGGLRHYGTNASEIAVGILPEMANADDFASFRASHVRYETLPEVWHWHQPGGGAEISGALSYRPRHMNIRPPIPLARRDAAGVAVADQVAIGGSVDELIASESAIVAAFAASGLSQTPLPVIDLSPAQVAFYNLVDYVDDDNLPGNLGGTASVDARIPSVESNPMFNEFEIEYTINVQSNAAGGWSYDVSGQVFFELGWFFPVNQFSGPYTFHHNVSFSSTAPGEEFAAGQPTPAQFTQTAAPSGSPHFWVFDADIPVLNGTIADFPGSFEINATVTTWTMYQGEVVDTNMPLTVNLPFAFTEPPNESITVTRGMECIDPRINFFEDLAGFPNWQVTNPDEAPSSMGSMNVRAQGMLDDDSETDGPGATFFVPNRPLRTVGELGYLFYGQPWQTIRLYRHRDAGGVYSETLHTVLDHFSMSTNTWQHGLINPNTEVLWALTAALNGMPYSADADASSPALTLAQAQTLAEAWSADAYNMGYAANLSDIGEFTNLFYETFVADWNEPQKEALFRNAAGLFHPRQNHFTIIVAVRSYGAAGQVMVGLRRMIAEVWRDPYRQPPEGGSPAGAHGAYLRFLRWVD